MIKKQDQEKEERYAMAGWHLDPKITVGALIAAVLALGSVVGGVVTMREGVKANADKIVEQQQRHQEALEAERDLTNQQIRALTQRVNQTANRMNRLESRLDTNLRDIKVSIDKGFSEVRSDVKYLMRNSGGSPQE